MRSNPRRGGNEVPLSIEAGPETAEREDRVPAQVRKAGALRPFHQEFAHLAVTPVVPEIAPARDGESDSLAQLEALVPGALREPIVEVVEQEARPRL